MKNEILNNDALTIRVDPDAVVDVVHEAIDATEQVLDVLEDQVVRVVTITRNNPFVIGGALIVGLSIGGFVAYKVAVKRTALKYEGILTQEIAAAKSFQTAPPLRGACEKT